MSRSSRKHEFGLRGYPTLSLFYPPYFNFYPSLSRFYPPLFYFYPSLSLFYPPLFYFHPSLSLFYPPHFNSIHHFLCPTRYIPTSIHHFPNSIRHFFISIRHSVLPPHFNFYPSLSLPVSILFLFLSITSQSYPSHQLPLTRPRNSPTQNKKLTNN